MINHLKRRSLSLSSISFLLVIIPCIIWVILGLDVCYLSSSGIYGIYAVLFPPFAVLFTYYCARVYAPIIGGIVLATEGLILCYIFLTRLTITQNIFMLFCFSFPLTISGLIFLQVIKHPKGPIH